MRVLIAAGIFPPDPGGPAIHAKTQYDYFKNSGIPVDLIVIARYRHLPFGIRHLIYTVRLLLKALHADIIYAHDALGVGMPAYVVARLLGKKIMVRIGGDIPWERVAEQGETHLSMKEWYALGSHKDSKLFRISNVILKRFDAIVVTTQLLKDVYATYYAVPQSKLHVIANPIPEKSAEAAPKGKDIIYASRLVAYKNLDFVIRELAQILPLYPEIRFVIMGDGQERASLESLTKGLHMEDRVIFKGKVSQEEVIEATRTCLFGLAPALTEFNPNYILQCIAYNKPFLISKENGLPYAVPEMFIFNPRNGEEFLKKLKELLNEEGYTRAQDLVLRIGFRMDWKANLEANLRIMKVLLDGSK